MASSSVNSNSAILTHLSHALLRISRIPPRVIASPPTQPRRASVAILLRVRPAPEDEAWLAQNHDPEAQQISPAAAGGDAGASHEMGSSGVHVSQASLGQTAGAAGVSSLASSVASADLSSTLGSFFDQAWVKRGTPEILYIKRAARIGDNWSAHVAFPGGRKEEGDENGLYTAMRETWEEVGIDLAEKEFSCVGQLDDREITTSLGKRLLMVLSPYVFVQTSPFSPLPDLQPSEVASAHWIPLSLLYTPKPKWGTTSVDISSRLAPKSPLVRWVLRALVGKMDFKCILLPNDPVAVAEYDENEEEGLADSSMGGGEKAGSHIARTEEGSVRPELRLWGLTLGMTLDLLSHMTTFNSSSSFRSGPTSPPTSPSRSWSALPSVPPLQDAASSTLPSASELVSSPVPSLNRVIGRIRDEFHLNPPPASHALAPSLTSVFPRFSYPDVNFWIWFFGWRYRNVVRGWESSVGTRMERKFNWSGMALGAFYSAQPSPAASTSQPVSTSDTDFRKAPADVKRIPGSAASMNVTERTKSHTSATPSASRPPAGSSALSRKTAIQAMQPFLTTSTTSSSPIQPTDIQLLTKSILSNQERQQIILHYQERLIDTCPSLSDLKESLLYLSASSWGQILEERKLAGKCSYPPCTNDSPSSAASGLGRQREGKFRINLRTKQVKSREELELGQAGNTWDELREFFCSKQCWARSEWILRWVLGEKELGFEDKGGGDKGVLGGKWQKLTSQGAGEEVELLEDIERQGGVWFDDSQERGAIDDVPEEEERKEVVAVERKDVVSGKSNVKQVSNLLGDLTIVERPKSNNATTTTPPISTSHPPKSSTTPYDVDVPNSLGHRFHPTTSSSNADIDPSSPTSLLPTSSQRELSHILRYASLATGSRRSQPNSSSAPTTATPHDADHPDDDAEEDGPTMDAAQAKERERLRRLMDVALDVRRDQRELGLLD
ncbi:hypothetical protein PHSY_005122 [Pseudozyma hubeiensis SY62]|uniref:RNA polymerase II subunit B1 CTD phosphatase RPAP2 homolog n=1 Tax=Pseudozyma hubeiensis (strain SY62) TaxID=1305764 RepID=R9P842_PSEHS|nr:hypothetical protein PHSY_005122 [Pseudozyma hubeiensis SY62]GAC97536.1 hypothetical protein PHSY_005122 [Pseudozyma hubeiensis SY62]